MTARFAAPYLPAVGVLAVWIALVPADGGYFPRDWLPAGLAFSGLWVVTVVAQRRLMPAGRAAPVAVGALIWLTLLSFASAAWADAPGAAWSTAGQLLCCVMAVWTLALLPWRPAAAQVFLGAFGLAAAVVFGIVLLKAPGLDNLASLFVRDRWTAPLGYANAVGNFGFFAALPLIAISASLERQVLLRAAMLAAATLLGGMALIPQSRGALIGLAVAIPVLVAVSPLRWRVVTRVVVAGAALALTAGPLNALLDVMADPEVTHVSPAVRDVAGAIWLATAVAFVAGLGLALVESRIRQGERTAKVARATGVAGLVALVLVGGGFAIAKADRIGDVLERQKAAWDRPEIGYVDETQDEEEARTGSRLLDPDPLQRYEYWHVALDAFADDPLLGLGAGGYDLHYTRVRAYKKYALFPHSLFMRALGEGGLWGAAGLLAFLAAALAGTLAGIRRASPAQRTVAAAALACAVLFIVHAQLDWIEEFPVLAGPATAFLVVAMISRRDGAMGRSRIDPRLRVVVGVLGLAVAVLLLAPPYVALRYKERAEKTWRVDPAAAYRDLDRSASLDRLSDAAFLSEGTIALQRRELPRARRAFEAALERADTWLPHFELALIEAAEGNEQAAMRQLDRARALNPQETAIPAAREAIRGDEVIDPIRLNRHLFESSLFKARRLT